MRKKPADLACTIMVDIDSASGGVSIYRTLQSLLVSISHAYAFRLGSQGYLHNIDLVLAFPLKVNKSHVDLLIKIDLFAILTECLYLFSNCFGKHFSNAGHESRNTFPI